MEAKIGEAAGAIWHYLDRHGQTTLSKLKHETKLSDQILLMGLGWLAREGKLGFAKERRTLAIGLKKQPPPAEPAG